MARAEKTRDVIFQEALDRVAAEGRIWNDLPGEERDEIVRSIDTHYPTQLQDEVTE